MPRTRPGARALTALLAEDVVWRAGGSGQGAADALAGVRVQVLVGGAAVSREVALAHTLTGLHVEFFIWATHVCGEHLCGEGGTTGEL